MISLKGRPFGSKNVVLNMLILPFLSISIKKFTRNLLFCKGKSDSLEADAMGWVGGGGKFKRGAGAWLGDN
jgi:hypothetical protein